MQALEFYDAFVGRLEELGIRYMVTGSVASIFHGEPRLTHDIDLVLFIGMRDVNRLVAAFPDDDYHSKTEIDSGVAAAPDLMPDR